MAQFIKFNCTAAAAQPVVLIPVDQIASVVTAANGLTTVIRLKVSATSAYTITHPAAPVFASVADNTVVGAIYRAMVANPGGIVSTVGSPFLTQQAPLPQTGSGRQLITAQATFVTYTQNAYAA